MRSRLRTLLSDHLPAGSRSRQTNAGFMPSREVALWQNAWTDKILRASGNAGGQMLVYELVPATVPSDT